MGEVTLKRGRWCVLFKERQFKFPTQEEAEAYLAHLEEFGLPSR